MEQCLDSVGTGNGSTARGRGSICRGVLVFGRLFSHKIRILPVSVGGSRTVGCVPRGNGVHLPFNTLSNINRGTTCTVCRTTRTKGCISGRSFRLRTNISGAVVRGLDSLNTFGSLPSAGRLSVFWVRVGVYTGLAGPGRGFYFTLISLWWFSGVLRGCWGGITDLWPFYCGDSYDYCGFMVFEGNTRFCFWQALQGGIGWGTGFGGMWWDIDWDYVFHFGYHVGLYDGLYFLQCGL